MAHELRIQVVIPLEGDAIARAKDVAAFEPTLDGFAEAVARAGGSIDIDVIKAKPRTPKRVAPESGTRSARSPQAMCSWTIARSRRSPLSREDLPMADLTLPAGGSA